MIIDFQTNPGHAALYDMVDAATGRSMYDRPIFYADDVTGVYRVYLKDAQGNFLTRKDHSGVPYVAWEERRGKFRLTLKSQAPDMSDVRGPGRTETWHDRKGML